MQAVPSKCYSACMSNLTILLSKVVRSLLCLFFLAEPAAVLPDTFADLALSIGVLAFAVLETISPLAIKDSPVRPIETTHFER